MVREVCNAMCEEYVDEVITAPPYLKNENNWQIVSSKGWTFLNCAATIDGKLIANRKRANSCSNIIRIRFFSSILLAIVDLVYKFV